MTDRGSGKPPGAGEDGGGGGGGGGEGRTGAARPPGRLPGIFHGPARGLLKSALAGNLAAFLVGVGVSFWFGRPAAVGYAVGFVIGAVNIFWLFGIAGKGLTVPREKVARFVAVRYYLRFVITALVFMALIVKASISPVPMLIGLSASLAATIAVLIIAAKKEAS
ncbi:MAG: ATP synthase subunit I [Thermodesulfobacteriota bacterium]